MEENNTMLNLFESFWFERMIFHHQPRTTKSSDKDSTEESDMKSSETSNQSLPTISSTESSIIAELDSSGDSPSSVLLAGKLQTIFSGKEIREGEKYPPPPTEREEKVEEEEETTKTVIMAEEQKHIRRNREMMMRMKRRGLSKSLTDLEFEEIKGFTDLGFVFSEEDRNSSFLASILPGLQRLGGGGVEEEEEEEVKRDEEQLQQLEPPGEDEERKGGMRRRRRSRSSSADRRMRRGISRPYLSEAWEVSYHPLMLKWEKIPSIKNEIDMKDYLKCWAHSVAESVR